MFNRSLWLQRYRWHYALILLSLAFGFLCLSSRVQAQEGNSDPVANVEVTVGDGTNFSISPGVIYRDKVDTCPVTITCTDTNGTAVANATVSISLSDTSVATVSPTSGTTDSNGNIQVTVTSADISSTNTTDTITASSQSASGTGTITLNGISIQSLTLSSGAIPEKSDVPNKGDQNWAAVKSATGYAIFTVTTQPNIPAVWADIVWSGGQSAPNEGANFHEYSLASSTKVAIAPTLAGVGLPNNYTLWIVWGNTTVILSGAVPSGAPPMNPHWDMQNDLGCVTYTSPTFGKAGAGKYVAQCVLTPSGINTIVTSSCSMVRKKNTAAYIDGTLDTSTTDGETTNGAWMDDSSSNATFYNFTPNSSDTIFDDDAPTVWQAPGATSTFQIKANFEEYATFNNTQCSNQTQCSYTGTWSAAATPTCITGQQLQNSFITLP